VQIQAQLLPFVVTEGGHIDLTEDAFATLGVALALTPTGSHRCYDGVQ
jgi:hypothetical protein